MTDLSPFYISSLYIRHFFELNDLYLDGFLPGVNLIIGPNEAGKSTILRFIRGVIYGFEKKYPRDWGGHLSFCVPGDNTNFEVQRYGGTRTGALRLMGADGERLPDAAMVKVTRGVGRSLFQNCFAFGLDELETLSSLKTKEMEEALFAASSGASPGAITRIRRYLEDHETSLFRPRGKKPIINRLIGELREKNEEITRKKADILRILETAREMENAQEEIQGLKGRIERLDRELQESILVDELFDTWLEYCALKDRIASMPTPPDEIDEGIGERFALVVTMMEQETLQLEKARLELEALNRRLDSIEIDPRLEEEREEILELFSLSHEISLSISTLDEKRSRIENLRQRLDTLEAQLGKRPDQTLLDKMDTGILFRQKVSKLYAAIDEVQEVLRAARREEEDISHDISEISHEIEEQEKEFSRISKDLEDTEEMKRRTDALFEEAQLAKGLKETAVENLRKRTRRSIAVAIAGNILFLFAISGRFFLYPNVSHNIEVVCAAILLLLDGLLGYSMVTLRKKGKDEIQAHEARIQGLDQEAKGLVKTMKDAFSQDDPMDHEKDWDDLIGQGRFIATMILERKRLQKRQLEAQIKTLNKKLTMLKLKEKEVKELLIQRQEVLDEKKRGLLNMLQQVGIQGPMDESHFIQYLDILQRIKEGDQEVKALKEDMEELSRTVDTFLARSHALFKRLDMAIALTHAKEAVKRIAELKGRLVENAERIRRRDELKEEQQTKKGEISSLEKKIESHRRELSALMDKIGAIDEDDFHNKLRTFKERKDIEARTKVLEVRLGQLGTGFHERFSSVERDELRQRMETLRREVEALQSKKDGLLKALGAFEEQKRQMAKKDELKGIRTEKEHLIRRLKELSKRWAVIKVSQRLFERARYNYEEKSQPVVLREGGRFFSIFTEGRYTTIHFDLEGQGIKVKAANGVWKQVDQLSRGTREQLFLALRFGYILSLDTNLPLVMDDILVNFDDKRARRAAGAIIEMAKSIQVLFFTCHPEVVGLFEHLGARSGVPLVFHRI